jgi:hypothetical protein
MKKILSFIIIIILPLGLIKSQEQIQSYGNNHVTTSAISFTPDGKLMLIGGWAKLYDVSIGKLDFRTLEKDYENQIDYAFDAILNSEQEIEYDCVQADTIKI